MHNKKANTFKFIFYIYNEKASTLKKMNFLKM